MLIDGHLVKPPLRLQVESELDMAKNKIDAITKQIDLRGSVASPRYSVVLTTTLVSSRSKTKQTNGSGPTKRKLPSPQLGKTLRDGDDKGMMRPIMGVQALKRKKA